jgi:hypothetical protein
MEIETWNHKTQNPNTTKKGISLNIKRVWIQVFDKYPSHIFPLGQVQLQIFELLKVLVMK